MINMKMVYVLMGSHIQVEHGLKGNYVAIVDGTDNKEIVMSLDTAIELQDVLTQIVSNKS